MKKGAKASGSAIGIHERAASVMGGTHALKSMHHWPVTIQHLECLHIHLDFYNLFDAQAQEIG